MSNDRGERSVIKVSNPSKPQLNSPIELESHKPVSPNLITTSNILEQETPCSLTQNNRPTNRAETLDQSFAQPNSRTLTLSLTILS